MIIATNVSTSTLSRPSFPVRPGGTTALALLGGGVILGFTLLRRDRRIWWYMQLGFTLLLATAFAVTACGGPGNATPNGTYTVTVTATAGSNSQTGTYTLTVQ
jgi:hypothetical protein